MALVYLSVLYFAAYKKLCFAKTCCHLSTFFEIGGALLEKIEKRLEVVYFLIMYNPLIKLLNGVEYKALDNNRVFNGFGQAKFADVGSILCLSKI